VLDEDGFGDHGTHAAGTSQSGDRRQQMQKNARPLSEHCTPAIDDFEQIDHDSRAQQPSSLQPRGSHYLPISYNDHLMHVDVARSIRPRRIVSDTLCAACAHGRVCENYRPPSDTSGTVPLVPQGDCGLAVQK
jgi:hypothetical protein